MISRSADSVDPLRIPENVLADLKRGSPALEFSGYQVLVQGLLHGPGMALKPGQNDASNSLRQCGTGERVIEEPLVDPQPPKWLGGKPNLLPYGGNS